jgi:predicted dehydrogenase
MSCHHFDLLVSWLGPAESMSAQAWGAPWSAYEHPNNTSAHIVFRNGTHVHYLHGHDAARASLLVELHGPGGATTWTEFGLSVNARPTANWQQTAVETIALEHDSGEAGVLEAFYGYLVADVEPGISARQNLEVMAICQMMVLSVEQQRPVQREELGQIITPR